MKMNACETTMLGNVARLVLTAAAAMALPALSAYVPTEGNLAHRRAFAADRFGIFIHWGL